MKKNPNGKNSRPENSLKVIPKKTAYMIRYKLGDILLLGFPQTDMKGTTKRPAIVLRDDGDLDVMVARITSQEYLSPSDHKIRNWKEAGLLNKSYVRLGKIATLEKGLVLRKLGSLSAQDINSIKDILRKMFS